MEGGAELLPLGLRQKLGLPALQLGQVCETESGKTGPGCRQGSKITSTRGPHLTEWWASRTRYLCMKTVSAFMLFSGRRIHFNLKFLVIRIEGATVSCVAQDGPRRQQCSPQGGTESGAQPRSSGLLLALLKPGTCILNTLSIQLDVGGLPP